MDPLTRDTETLPPGWKWTALMTPPAGFEAAWRALLATAQREEEAALLRYWARRAGDGRGDALAA